MKKILKILFSPILGRRIFQGFFRLIYRFSLKGMNYGNGADFKNSGEEWVLKQAKKNYQGQSPFVLFDAGANEGGYALAARAILRNCEIYAFEPAPKTFLKLQAAAANFPDIKIFSFGFSSQRGQSSLFFSESASGLASLYRRPILAEKMLNAEPITVNLDTVDNFCTANNIGRINFLKIDAEGHELEVIKGAGRMINSRKIDYIQFEFGGTDIDARVFLKDFFSLLGPGYAISRILKDGLLPVAYSEAEEIFTTTNYLAELK